jgi:hypothetical protein
MPVANRLPLSVAIITLNEVRNLPRWLESIHELVAEIIVICSNSRNRTRSVAAREIPGLPPAKTDS